VKTLEHDDDIDQDEFAEYRRMSGDVLVVCYFLLRSDFVQYVVSAALSGPASRSEAALFCLTAVAREINARIVSHTTGASCESLISKDRHRTVELLLQTAQYTCMVPTKDIRISTASAFFVESFASTWATQCSAEDILKLLAHLRSSMLSGGDINRIASRSVDADGLLSVVF
jgi:hypothetical protein